MTTNALRCGNCGSVLPPQTTNFCPNCGTRIVSLSTPTQQDPAPGYYPPVPPTQPVSTGPYKAVIGILLIIIILFGVAWYATSHGPLFSLGTNGYRYQIPNPPNAQSIQPPNSITPTASSQTITWNTCGTGPNQPCSITAPGWREGTVPDTYDYYVTFTSTVTITVYFFTLGQFVQFAVCNGNLSCVSGYYVYLPASLSQQNNVFKLAEGCADYVAIYISSANGTMTPNVGVATNPYNGPTGYCAQT